MKICEKHNEVKVPHKAEMLPHGVRRIKWRCRTCERIRCQKYNANGTSTYAAKRAWDKRNRVKRRAHKLVENALLSGSLRRQPCEKCGDVERIHAHHDDYSKPLAVKWLCPKCHADRHVELRSMESPPLSP